MNDNALHPDRRSGGRGHAISQQRKALIKAALTPNLPWQQFPTWENGSEVKANQAENLRGTYRKSYRLGQGDVIEHKCETQVRRVVPLRGLSMDELRALSADAQKGSPIFLILLSVKKFHWLFRLVSASPAEFLSLNCIVWLQMLIGRWKYPKQLFGEGLFVSKVRFCFSAAFCFAYANTAHQNCGEFCRNVTLQYQEQLMLAVTK
jgi:hypothetical protein